MAVIKRFEDLIARQKARQLANLVYDLTDLPPFRRDPLLRNQLRDAAGSAMHNIAEGFDAGTPAEYVRFLKMSRRSCSEVQSELYLALDREYIAQEQFTAAYTLSGETKQVINGLIAYLRKKLD